MRCPGPNVTSASRSASSGAGRARRRSFEGLAASVLLVVAACNAPPRMDLRRNPDFYQPTGYAATSPADRDAFVAPVVDERTPPQDVGQLPTVFLSDRDWERPVPVMLHEILCDELRDSGVFHTLLDAASPDALLVKPILRSFDGGVQEQLYGRRSLAAVGLQIEVYGPLIDGERKLVLTQPLFERPVSSPGFKPASPRVLLGAALHATMSRLVGAIDASNVGRSAVVTDADLRKHD